MDKKDVELLVSRFNKLKNDRSDWEGMWQKANDYLSPVPRDLLNTGTRTGPKKKVEVLDTTGREAMVQLAHALNGTLTNPSTEWFRATVDNANLANDPDVRAWLDVMAKITNHHLQQSNFTEAMIEVYKDLLVYGTGGLLIEEGKKNDDLITFRARNVAEVVVVENEDGRIDTIFRKSKMSARQAYQRFGEKVSRNIKKALEKEPDKDFDILHVIKPREKYSPEKLGKKDKPIASIWIELDASEILDEGGYEEHPLPVARWDKMSGDVYGYGPGLQCLNDVVVLNKMEEWSLRAKALGTAPPALIDDDALLSEFKWEPFIRIYKRANNRNGSDGVKVLNPQVQPQLADSAVQDRREQIRRTFFGDIIINQTVQYVTAEGIRQNADERERVLTSVLGRLQSELLEPIVTRVFGILSRKGAFPPPPKALQGQDWRAVWTSPLARKQEERKADAIAKTVQMIGMVAQVAGPQVAASLMERFDVDKLSLELAEIYGVPRSLIRSDYTIKQERQAREQAMQQQMQSQQLIQEGTALAQMESQTAQSSGPVGSLMKQLGNGMQ